MREKLHGDTKHTYPPINPKTEKGRLSDPSMSLVLFTDPGLFLNVPKAEEVYNEGCPVENTPFPLPAPETEISLDIGSPPSDTLNITRR